jgi:hypothetical protein
MYYAETHEPMQIKLDDDKKEEMQKKRWKYTYGLIVSVISFTCTPYMTLWLEKAVVRTGFCENNSQIYCIVANIIEACMVFLSFTCLLYAFLFARKIDNIDKNITI